MPKNGRTYPKTYRYNTQLRMAPKEEGKSRLNHRNTRKQTDNTIKNVQHTGTRTDKGNTRNAEMARQHQKQCSPNMRRIHQLHRQNMGTTKIQQSIRNTIHTHRTRDRQPHIRRNSQNRHTPTTPKGNRSKNRRSSQNRMDRHRLREKSNYHQQT